MDAVELALFGLAILAFCAGFFAGVLHTDKEWLDDLDDRRRKR